MIEFDVPGHGASWCTGYPDACPAPDCRDPLDPSSPTTWQLINGLLNEATGGKKSSGIFPDDFIHLGGDEVSTSCWDNSARIVSWLKAHNMTDDQAYMYFVETAHNIVIGAGRSPVNWEEVYQHFGTSLDKETVVHIWLNFDNLARVVADGYRALLSNNDKWYLDHMGTTWQTMYLNEPFAQISDPTQQRLVLGGEACMWSENIDTSDVHQTIWPRGAAVAERLWSDRLINDTIAALPRLEAFRCHFNSRNIAAAPVNNANARTAPPGPGGCYVQ